MRKVLFLFHPLKEIDGYTEAWEEQLCRHHFWGYDSISESDYEIVNIEDFDKKHWLNSIGEKLKITHLKQQIDAVRKSKDYDIIFVPYINYAFVLAVLKLLGLFHKPIVGIAHKIYSTDETNWFLKLRQKIIRFIYLNGVDSPLFFNEAMQKADSTYGVKGNAGFLKSWGADLEFFQSYANNQEVPPASNFFYAAGSSARDYKTLITAFNEIDFNLKITTSGDFDAELLKKITPNIIIDDSVPAGWKSTTALRKEYYNSYAVVIPVLQRKWFEVYGITVFMEAMAMGRPLIVTDSKLYPFDVEKEKVGLKVGYGDVAGWRQAANYLIDHPDEAREMGARSLYLAKHKYNYELFSKEVVEELDRYLVHKNPTPVRVSGKRDLVL